MTKTLPRTSGVSCADGTLPNFESFHATTQQQIVCVFHHNDEEEEEKLNRCSGATADKIANLAMCISVQNGHSRPTVSSYTNRAYRFANTFPPAFA